MGTIIFIIAFICVFLVALKVGMSFSTEGKISRRRVANLVDTESSFVEIQEDFEREKSFLASAFERLVSNFRSLGEEGDELSYKLYRAGATSPNATAYYLFFSTFGWVLGLFLFFLFYAVAKSHKDLFLIIVGVGVFNALLATFGAQLWLKNSIEKRQKILLHSFPDTLDLLLVCVESGLALDASLARVCKELKFAHPEMTEELNRTRIELTMLNDREKALNNFAKRTDLIAVKSLVAALLQSEKFGTSLVETLRVLSDDYRNTRMMLAEEKAGKLPTKIAVSTLPLMLMALLTLITSPAVIRAAEVISQSNLNQ